MYPTRLSNSLANKAPVTNHGAASPSFTCPNTASHYAALTRKLLGDRLMFRCSLVVALLLCASVASAQQWAEKMFAERVYDFGGVARAAKVEHNFVITNPYKEDVHIASVRSSCGCTQPRIVNDTLKSHETGAVVAAFNTRAFTGQRGATVTVTFDRPRYAEVSLNVRGYIRTDVVLNPGQVNFGSVNTGEAAEKEIKVNYAGRDDWQITGVNANSPYLTAEVKELSRKRGRVSYNLDVKLKENAPIGYLQQQIVLLTNDQRSSEVPVNVEGLIVAELAVSPSSLMLGTVQSGQTVNKQIVVRGAKPFKIVEVRCDNSAFQFQTGDEAKTVHLVPVTYQAAGEPGKIHQKIEIVTDLEGGKTASLTALGQITAPLAGK